MIIIGGLFQFGASTAVMFMVTYATEDVILLSAAQWGLINTASQIVSMLITLPISMLIDRYGRIRPVIFSLLTTPILIGGFLLSRNFTWTFTFYIFLTITTFSVASLGLFVTSFFDSMSKAFGVFYLIMITLMIPVFSYYIPGFDPLWLRFFPTYPMLQGFKEIILNGDAGYVLTYSSVFLAGGLVLFVMANIRFKKTLTM